MNILGIISAPDEPASRFRIAQYQPYFHSLGDNLKLYIPSPRKDADPPKWAHSLGKLTTINKWRIWNTARLAARFPLLFEQRNHDMIWQNRLLLNTYFFVENYYKKPFVFDIDDAVWLLDGEKPIKKAFTKAAAVITGNEYLAEYAKKSTPNVHIVPTVIDTKKLYPAPSRKNRFTIGWIGTYHNFRYLKMIKVPLLSFLRRNTDAACIIVSSTPPSFLPFDNERIIFREWSFEEENKLINEFSVGLMPLEDTDWTRGKCSCKMLQYMACGVPPIVSPVGQNKLILTESNAGLSASSEQEWEQIFQQLKDDHAMYKEISASGVDFVRERYSCESTVSEIQDIFQRIQ